MANGVRSFRKLFLKVTPSDPIIVRNSISVALTLTTVQENTNQESGARMMISIQNK